MSEKRRRLPNSQEPSFAMCRLTRYSWRRLLKMRDRLQQEVYEHPENHPCLAGRRVTISDTIVQLCEDKTNDRQ